MDAPRIGFIGQGWIGKNYADDFAARGYAPVRYALEPEYAGNRERIMDCDIVFIAVPTPTRPGGFDGSHVESALRAVRPGAIAVIKSTLIPGTTERLQRAFPHLTVLHSPEFLSTATAAKDAAHPFANIIGMPAEDERHRAAAAHVLSVLPQAPFSHVCSSAEAELIKYAHNLNGYFSIILFNLLYDASQALGADWQSVETAVRHDPYVSPYYVKPVHKGGRGAGGGCFVKDFAAFRMLYERHMPEDARGAAVFAALERKNFELLRASGKDTRIITDVYGPAALEEPHLWPALLMQWRPGRYLGMTLMAAGFLIIGVGSVDLLVSALERLASL